MVAHLRLKRKRTETSHGDGLLIVHHNAVEGNPVCVHRRTWLGRKVLKISLTTLTTCQIVKFCMASCAKAWRCYEYKTGLTSLTVSTGTT